MAALWAELRNILIVSERRGRLPPGMVAVFLEPVAGLGIRLDTDPAEADVLQLARRHGLTVYDALYLELALRLGASLVTLDGRLADGALWWAVNGHVRQRGADSGFGELGPAVIG